MLYESLAQIFRPVRQEGHKLLASTDSARVWTRAAVDKHTGQQIKNTTHPGQSRCWKWSLLLCKRSLHFRKMFTFMHLSSFSETERDWNFKSKTSNPALLRNSSKGFSVGMLKPSTNCIQFFFGEHLGFWFCSYLPCLSVFIYDCTNSLF
jgi:hypothetical protein